MEKLSLGRQKAAAVTSKTFNFPFFSYNYFGTLSTSRYWPLNGWPLNGGSVVRKISSEDWYETKENKI